jgi:hypothetical protein
MRFYAVALLFAGCGFRAEEVATDLAGVDFSGSATDFGASADQAPSGDLPAVPCTLPMLLVAVENLHNPATGGGQVARLALGDGTALPSSCSSLSGQGLMTPEPWSLAAVADRIAIVGIDELQLLDPASDTIVWSKPVGASDVPVDVFALKHPDGRILAAAAYGGTGESAPYAIWRVDAWALDGTLVKSWSNSDLTLSLGILGMTSYPLVPTHFLALDSSNNVSAWDVDPWSTNKVQLFGAFTGSPITIFADTWSTEMRTVWTDSSLPTTAVLYNNSDISSLLGPISCANCTLIHAVADPTINTRFFGLCDGGSLDSRRVVRFSSTGGSCDTVLEGAAFGGESHLSQLGIVQ